MNSLWSPSQLYCRPIQSSVFEITEMPISLDIGHKKWH